MKIIKDKNNEIIFFHSLSTPIVDLYLLGILAVPIVMPGLMLIFNNHVLLGWTLILLWTSLFTIKQGAKIDFNKKNISFFYSYLWIQKDSWRKSEEFQHYKILTVHKSYSLSTAKGPSSTIISYKKRALDLFDNKEKKYKRVALAKPDEVNQIRQLLEAKLNIKKGL
jgi:hypothetical protein